MIRPKGVEQIWRRERQRAPEVATLGDWKAFCRLANVGSGNQIAVETPGLGLALDNLKVFSVNEKGPVNKVEILNWAWTCNKVRYWARHGTASAKARTEKMFGCREEV